MSQRQRSPGCPRVKRDTRHDGAVEEAIEAGLGLEYQDLRLGRTTDGWVLVGASLRDRVEEVLGPDADACRAYEAVKLQLVERFAEDRKSYTDGKSAIVGSLLDELG